MASTAALFGGVGTVLIQVADQDRALDFYVGTLGFEKVIDWPSPAGRWIEVLAPGATTSIALVGPQPDGAVLSLATADAAAAHAALTAAGADVSPLIEAANGVPAMFGFRDRDGTAIRVSER